MHSAQYHPREEDRLLSLQELQILDTDAEAVFDEITELAANICNTPIALVSLIDQDRQWFKSRQGLDATETPRDIAFCSHAILQDDVFVVENALEDPRFRDNPLAVNAPHVIFYAGAVIKTAEGLPLGTLCVIDNTPRQLADKERRALEILKSQVEAQIRIRSQNLHLSKLNQQRATILALAGHDLKGAFTSVLGLASILDRKIGSAQVDALQSMTQRLVTSSNNVYQLLEDLLLWAHSQVTGCKTILEPLSLAQEVEACIELNLHKTRHKNITVVQAVEGSVEVAGHKQITRTLLRNLLENAIKYSPDFGEIRVSFEIKHKKGLLSITDQGPGIPPDQANQLFQECCDSQSGTAGEQGHGIGMYLCNMIAKEQKSELWVENPPEGGTRIVVSFLMDPQ